MIPTPAGSVTKKLGLHTVQWLTHYLDAITLSNDCTVAWVTRPQQECEETKSSRPEGPKASQKGDTYRTLGPETSTCM